jgi:hypothetical protein
MEDHLLVQSLLGFGAADQAPQPPQESPEPGHG